MQEFVKKGDLLLQLDAKLVELEIEKLEAQIRMKEKLDSTEARIKHQYSVDNLNIIRKLSEKILSDMPVASEKELKEAEQRAKISEIELQRAELEIALLKVELKTSRKVLSQHAIEAPMDGVIVPFKSISSLNVQPPLKELEEGEMAQAGRPMLAMMKVDAMRVDFIPNEDQLKNLRLGQSARIYVRGVEGEPVEGKVVYISPTMSTMGKSVWVTVEFVNPRVKDYQKLPRGAYRYKYRHNMQARVELVLRTAESAG